MTPVTALRTPPEHDERLRTALARQAVQRRVAEPLSVRASWLAGEYDLAQRRAVLAVFLERIDVGPARPGDRFQPDRLRLACGSPPPPAPGRTRAGLSAAVGSTTTSSHAAGAGRGRSLSV